MNKITKIGKKSDRKYLCEYCSKTFNDNSNRHRHQKYRCSKKSNISDQPKDTSVIYGP